MFSDLAWAFLGSIAPRVAWRAALLGGGAVPHIPLLGIPLAARHAHLLASISPAILHRFGAWEREINHRMKMWGNNNNTFICLFVGVLVCIQCTLRIHNSQFQRMSSREFSTWPLGPTVAIWDCTPPPHSSIISNISNQQHKYPRLTEAWNCFNPSNTLTISKIFRIGTNDKGLKKSLFLFA